MHTRDRASLTRANHPRRNDGDDHGRPLEPGKHYLKVRNRALRIRQRDLLLQRMNAVITSSHRFKQTSNEASFYQLKRHMYARDERAARCNCRGGPPWPPVVRSTPCSPYSCTV